MKHFVKRLASIGSIVGCLNATIPPENFAVEKNVFFGDRFSSCAVVQPILFWIHGYDSDRSSVARWVASRRPAHLFPAGHRWNNCTIDIETTLSAFIILVPTLLAPLGVHYGEAWSDHFLYDAFWGMVGGTLVSGFLSPLLYRISPSRYSWQEATRLIPSSMRFSMTLSSVGVIVVALGWMVLPLNGSLFAQLLVMGTILGGGVRYWAHRWSEDADETLRRQTAFDRFRILPKEYKTIYWKIAVSFGILATLMDQFILPFSWAADFVVSIVMFPFIWFIFEKWVWPPNAQPSRRTELLVYYASAAAQTLLEFAQLFPIPFIGRSEGRVFDPIDLVGFWFSTALGVFMNEMIYRARFREMDDAIYARQRSFSA